MSWDVFWMFASVAVCLWVAASALALFFDKGDHGNHSRKAYGSRFSSRIRTLVISLITVGLIVYASFIVGFWISLGRPPLRTTGETRLWYSFFMMISALITYCRWGYRWIPSFSTLVATVFVCLNLFKPEIHDESLMPALQSWWFIPHVSVYIFSYSVLACAFLLAIAGMVKRSDRFLEPADTLVYIGICFLSLGMLSGSLWAKQAWGNYWNWDPKETWAAITWCIYLIYIHARLRKKQSATALYILLIAGFIGLQLCWWGVNYLPSAQESMRTYINN